MRPVTRAALVAAAVGVVAACSSNETQPQGPVGTASAPTFSPSEPLNFAPTLEVELATATAGATIRYTTDGSAPAAASAAYTGPITLAATTTIHAIATHPGMHDSEVASATYTYRVVALAVDSGTWGPNGGGAAPREWILLNRFTPAPEDFPFRLRTVEVGFFTSYAGTPVRLAVYSDDDTSPGNGAVLEATYDVTVLNNGAEVAGMTWSVYELSPPVLLSGPGDVLIAYIPLTDTFGFPLNDGAQGRSFWGFWDGGVPDPPALSPGAGFGFVDMGYNILLRGSN